MAEETKELGINPKDALGLKKVPMGAVSPIAIAHESLAMLDGELKYGFRNWRKSKVRARIYVDAAKRHLDEWLEGVEVAEDSGVHHLGHARACLGILLDAQATGNLVDDRGHTSPDGYRKVMAELSKWVRDRMEKHAAEEAAKGSEGSNT